MKKGMASIFIGILIAFVILKFSEVFIQFMHSGTDFLKKNSFEISVVFYIVVSIVLLYVCMWFYQMCGKSDRG